MSLHRDRILYEDQWLLAVHKLPGELTVAGKGKMLKLPLLDFVQKAYPGIHPVNRLDFETSGIVLFAKARDVLATVIKSRFQGWVKTYKTIVAGRMKKDRGEIRLRLPSRSKGEDVEAVTKYRVIERFAFSSFVEAEIEAGKQHQIRRHLSMIGYPLALDYEYGEGKFNNLFSQKFRFHRFFLHASRVRFPHPVTSKHVTIEDPLPRSFEGVLEKLRKAAA